MMPTTPPVPTPLGAVAASSSSGGQDNLNYAATGTSRAQVEAHDFIRANHFKDDRATKMRILKMLPPDAVLITDFQVRGTTGHFGSIYAPSLIYADNRRSLDFGLQHFDGAVSGYSLLARVDLSDARRKYVKSIDRAKDADLDRTSLDTLNRYVDTAAKDYISSTRGIRTAAILGYQSFSDIGSIFSTGVSVSELIRFRERDHLHSDGEAGGITPLLNIDYAQFNPSAPRLIGLTTASMIRVRTALILQDRTLFLGKNDAVDGRWHYQVGFEHDFKSLLDQVDTTSAFVRLRGGPHFQFTLYGGVRSDKQQFIGANVAFSIKLERGHKALY